MSRKQRVQQWVWNGITGVLFSWYYVLLGTLCWLLVTPDLLDALHVLWQHKAWMNVLWWGGISSVYFTTHGLLGALKSIDRSFKQREYWDICLKQGVNAAGCLSLMMAPIYAVHYNMAIRAANHPSWIIVLTSLFAYAATDHYLRVIKRAPSALMEMAHA